MKTKKVSIQQRFGNRSQVALQILISEGLGYTLSPRSSERGSIEAPKRKRAMCEGCGVSTLI